MDWKKYILVFLKTSLFARIMKSQLVGKVGINYAIFIGNGGQMGKITGHQSKNMKYYVELKAYQETCNLDHPKVQNFNNAI